MTMFPRTMATLLLLAIAVAPAVAQGRRGQAPTKPAEPNKPAAEKLAMCGLPPAKITPNLCLLKYRISTTSPECQAHFDQGLGYFYSYVWMEASRSFETAVKLDPDCAIAWWGLSRALERWGKNTHNEALKKAHELIAKASHREQLLITTRLQEKGMWPNVGDAEARKRAAIKTLDEMISMYEDDEEAWYYRALFAGGTGFGGTVGAVPYYLALLRINPLHPGANHELVHYYEKGQRPALGWVYAEKYIESSPGLPHAFHMQAHLGTRIGKWDKTSDYSAKAIELQNAYHRQMDVRPNQDQQYTHHMEILTISLVHDGRFREARQIKAIAQAAGLRQQMPWFRLHLGERDWTEALKIAEGYRKNDKVTASYLTALVHLRQDDPVSARPCVEVLQEAFAKKKSDKQLEERLYETQGMLMCQTGDVDSGLKLLAKCVERTKDNYGHHAWGNGSYFMECWGVAALKCGRDAVAEEAFLEALAHDPGSVRGAIGMQVLCERQGRLEEAQRFAALARKCWRRAEVQAFDAEMAWLRDRDRTAVTQLETLNEPRPDTTNSSVPK